jgi:hypothetical protein
MKDRIGKTVVLEHTSYLAAATGVGLLSSSLCSGQSL